MLFCLFDSSIIEHHLRFKPKGFCVLNTDQKLHSAHFILKHLLDKREDSLGHDGMESLFLAINILADARRELNQPVARLAGTLYQACGAYDMPERVLDVLSAAANGEPLEHMIDGVLPCYPPQTSAAPVSSSRPDLEPDVEPVPDAPWYHQMADAASFSGVKIYGWSKSKQAFVADTPSGFWNAETSMMDSAMLSLALGIRYRVDANNQVVTVVARGKFRMFAGTRRFGKAEYCDEAIRKAIVDLGYEMSREKCAIEAASR